ncbi:MAG: hypothetical protein FD152_2373 [Xanthobacteraceae bacterium]|nr:MAG: hypothetical protein FD152_2373 [Xanthobacteraceae bacterium]
MQFVVTEKGADAALEAAVDRLPDGDVTAVQPPDRPLPARRVEGPDRGGPVAATRQVQDIVVDVSGTAKDRQGGAGAAELLPLRVSREPRVSAESRVRSRRWCTVHVPIRKSKSRRPSLAAAPVASASLA